MEELKVLLETVLNENFLQAIISGARKEEGPSKIKIRSVQVKDGLCFQTAVSDGKKELHKNYGKQELCQQILIWMQDSYKQLQIDTTDSCATVLSSKKGKITIKRKKLDKPKQAAGNAHNRTKHYLLKEGTPVPFLMDLGVMTAEGKVINGKYDKFKQINRFLEFVQDILPQLEKDKELTIIDFGCGKSYLTFAMYYYLSVMQKLDVHMIGLDLKEDVIEKCSRLARDYGYEKLEFLVGDISSYKGADKVDMVVTLHACDTATDYAIEKAVRWNAKVILSVPCCQHELNGQIHNELMEPILKYGLIKERMAALITDALRAGRLEDAGYKVQILEFIDMEHTPKNILIRGVRTKNAQKEGSIDKCMEFWGVTPKLNELLNAKEEA